eukprot:CAMPEP_0194783676 /NCGR_PEP_ID=MMETSP0323_2-20130528/79355_1 /TAXON_ID=2866 ORGANISM="Crypthecodinium cohnii, Strain Seligo" /NCGR_SAMPLE_ID=MMETSP0323_2 /ASSEMBLY_ACC=CAM_ASM_000346 /LENGTH=49 /DNA_ID= /DNA_START= /DNA_END= /DNA_ORIENTATION=
MRMSLKRSGHNVWLAKHLGDAAPVVQLAAVSLLTCGAVAAVLIRVANGL